MEAVKAPAPIGSDGGRAQDCAASRFYIESSTAAIGRRSIVQRDGRGQSFHEKELGFVNIQYLHSRWSITATPMGSSGKARNRRMISSRGRHSLSTSGPSSFKCR